MKIIQYLVMFMLVCLAFLVGLYAYWSFEGTFYHKILSVKEIYLTTTQQVYTNEELVQGFLKLCKYRNIQATVQWSLVDTYLRTYPLKTTASPAQCFDTIASIEMISPTLPPGTYYFTGTSIFQLNPIKQIVIPMRTNKFEVVSNNPKN